MKKTELIFSIISVIAVGINIFLIPFKSLYTVISLATLSMIYFYFGFALFNEIRFRNILKKQSYQGISTKRIIGAIGVGIALSITILGILFKFQIWQGSYIYLVTGLTLLLIIAIIGMIKNLKTKSLYYSNILKRTLIIGGIGLIIFLLPTTTLLDFKYRNYPVFLNALKKALTNPTDTSLWKNVEEERLRVINDQ